MSACKLITYLYLKDRKEQEGEKIYNDVLRDLRSSLNTVRVI